ncbi:MAG TPA: hypothetical protein VGM54_09865 [Chthoniobacter sp.]|jgi:hypothetical protein
MKKLTPATVVLALIAAVFLLLPLALLSGCATRLYVKGVKVAELGGDYSKVEYSVDRYGATKFGAESAIHSTATKAVGEAVTRPLIAAGADAVPFSPLAKSGAAAVVPVLNSFLNRPTNRGTPTPKPTATPIPK